jgi:hypothetical protein
MECGRLARKMLVDCNGEEIGELQDVYVDAETDEPQFATVKEGFMDRHLTFVPSGRNQDRPPGATGTGDERDGEVGAKHRATRRSCPRQMNQRSITTTNSITLPQKRRADADWPAADVAGDNREQGLRTSGLAPAATSDDDRSNQCSGD